jgi:DNA-binding SARP family transcriptional activator
VLDPHSNRGQAALHAANRIESRELQQSVTSVLNGEAEFGILQPFIDSRVLRQVPHDEAVSVEVFLGRVVKHRTVVELSDEEFEVLSYLALARGALSRSRICDDIWPHLEQEDARNNLKVTFSRLRRRLTDDQIVLFMAGSYKLDPSVNVDVRHAESLLKSCEPGKPLHPKIRSQLEILHASRCLGLPPRFERYEWFSSHAYRIGDIASRIGPALGSDALLAGNSDRALAIARDLNQIDPLDEAARSIAVQAHTAMGNLQAAAHEGRSYAIALEQTLGAKPSAAFVELLDHTLRRAIK